MYWEKNKSTQTEYCTVYLTKVSSSSRGKQRKSRRPDHPSVLSGIRISQSIAISNITSDSCPVFKTTCSFNEFFNSKHFQSFLLNISGPPISSGGEVLIKSKLTRQYEVLVLIPSPSVVLGTSTSPDVVLDTFSWYPSYNYRSHCVSSTLTSVGPLEWRALGLSYHQN